MIQRWDQSLDQSVADVSLELRRLLLSHTRRRRDSCASFFLAPPRPPAVTGASWPYAPLLIRWVAPFMSSAASSQQLTGDLNPGQTFGYSVKSGG